MEKKWCIIFRNQRKVGWRKYEWFNEPFTCMAHKYSSAIKEYAKHHPERLIVDVFVEYKKRER